MAVSVNLYANCALLYFLVHSQQLSSCCVCSALVSSAQSAATLMVCVLCFAAGTRVKSAAMSEIVRNGVVTHCSDC